MDSAARLLARLTELRQRSEEVTGEEGPALSEAIKLFGELRYEPAIDLLVAEAFSPGLRWRVSNPSAGGWGRWEPLPFEDRRPCLAALVRIGPPAVPPLVAEYIRYWKIGREPQKAGVILSELEYALTEDALVGATLIHIQKRLVKAQFVEVDRDELDALQHLRQELFKRID